MFNEASKGDTDALKSLREVMRDRSFKHTKLDLFGAAESSDIFAQE